MGTANCLCEEKELQKQRMSRFLQNHNYPLPSPEEIFAQLNDGIFFSFVGLVRCLPTNTGRRRMFEITINTHKGLLKIGEGGVEWEKIAATSERF